MMPNYTALETYLEPLHAIFHKEGVNEISINEPEICWVEEKGEIYPVKLPEYDYEHLRALAKLVAQSTEQIISEEHPLLSATLPNGYRIQIVYPPACEPGKVVMSIRKSSTMNLTLNDYEKIGAFSKTTIEEADDPNNSKLDKLLSSGRIKDFIYYSIQWKKNIIISGGTSTGKTTFTNACLQAIPRNERIITIEDAREIKIVNPNKVHLVASKGGQGRAKVQTQELIEACLRLRPDRIIVGELRGAEAFSFLRAINTGHPGSISTLHADTPLMAIEQLKLMVMQAGMGMQPGEVKDYIRNVVDIIVQLKRGSGGTRFVSEIYFKDRK